MPYHFILPEDPPVFPTFFRAVFAHWEVLMSGGVITVLLGVFEKFSAKDIPYPVYIAVIILFVFIACFLAWKDARNEMYRYSLELAKKEQELLDQGQNLVEKEQSILELKQVVIEEKSKRTPDLAGIFINLITVGKLIGQDDETFSGLTCFVSISNRGMPSIATDWRLILSIPNIQPFMVMPTHFPESTSLMMNSQVGFEISGKDAIYNKTENAPIPTGGREAGYLYFVIPFSRDKVFVNGTKLEILFNDIVGKEYSIVEILQGKDDYEVLR